MHTNVHDNVPPSVAVCRESIHTSIPFHPQLTQSAKRTSVKVFWSFYDVAFETIIPALMQPSFTTLIKTEKSTARDFGLELFLP